jgi:hypothetical protein
MTYADICCDFAEIVRESEASEVKKWQWDPWWLAFNECDDT